MNKIAEIALEIDLIIQAALLIVIAPCEVFGLITGEIAFGAFFMFFLGFYQTTSAIFLAILMKDINRLYYFLAAALIVIIVFSINIPWIMIALPMIMAFYYYWYCWRFNEEYKIKIEQPSKSNP